MKTVITADRLITPDRSIVDPVVVVEDGVIARMESRANAEFPSAKHLDFTGCTLVPAFFDIHIHGSAGRDVMEGTPDAFTTVGKFLARHGVGAYLPTTVTAAIDVTLKSLERMSAQIGRDTEGAAAARHSYRGTVSIST